MGKGCFERLVFLNPSPLQHQKNRHVKSLLWKKKCHIFPFNFLNVSGGKDIVFGNYCPGWKLHRKLFTTALRQYLADIPLIESRVNTQGEKLVLSMEKQQGQSFDPADCLMRAVADVICGITFGEGYDTSNPDLNKLLKLNVESVANAADSQLATILDFFPWHSTCL